MSEEKPPLHVVELIAENIKKIRAVRVKPGDGSLVLIGGANGAGKSSLIDAIAMALGGADEIPPDPIRHGARKAEVVVDLGEIIVERSFTAKGTRLVVKQRRNPGDEGLAVKSPQKLLDELTAAVSFDPFAFSRMKPKEQDEVLKRVLGLDFAELDQTRAGVFAERTEVNRQVKALEARLDAMPEPEAGLPADETSATDILAEIEKLGAIERQQAAAHGELEKAQGRQLDLERDLMRIDGEITELEGKIGALKKKAATIVEERAAVVAEVKGKVSAIERLVPPDLETPKKRLASIEQTNAKVRAWKEREKLERELVELEKSARQMTDAIEHVDQKKQEALAAAKFPVAGLGFDEIGVTLDGVPFEQASQAQKLRASVAIGAALNRRVKVVLVREGSFLDRESLKLLAELAAEHGLQVFVERVGDGDESAIIIEEGLVRGSAEAAAE